MTTKKKTTTKGKAKGSDKGKKGAVPKPSDEAVAYAQKAYDAALAHYAATEDNRAARSLLAIDYDTSDPKALAIAVRVPGWIRSEHTDEEARMMLRDVELLVRTLEQPDCSEEFAAAFGSIYTDRMLGGSGISWTTPEVLRVQLPLVIFEMYRRARPANADTALEIFLTLREALNKDEVAERAHTAVFPSTAK